MRRRTQALAVGIALATVGVSIYGILANSGQLQTVFSIIAGLVAVVAILNMDRRTYEHPRSKQPETELLKEEYLRKWITLERIMRTRLTESSKEDYSKVPLSVILRTYSKILNYTGERNDALMRSLRLRNNIVHASAASVTPQEIFVGISELDTLLNDVQVSGNPPPTEKLTETDARPPLIGEAAIHQGALLADRGDMAGAQAAFQQAVNTGNPDVVPRALFSLGTLLAGQSDSAGAEAAFQQAIDTGNPDIVPLALHNLGTLRAELGDIAGAEAAFQQAIDIGNPDTTPRTLINLGTLLARTGDITGARAAFQRAIDSGDQHVASEALCNLGEVAQQEGDFAGARAAFQRAIDSGDPDVAARALVNLGIVAQQEGDFAGARAAFQRAIDSGDQRVALGALLNLGIVAQQEGDFAGARAAFQRAIDSGDPDVINVARGLRQNLRQETTD